MSNTLANHKWYEHRAEQLTHMEQLRRVELFNGRAAMLGIVIGIVNGIVVEGLTGYGIAHQIGLGALMDGYAACRTQFLPFCFCAFSRLRHIGPDPQEGAAAALAGATTDMSVQ